MCTLKKIGIPDFSCILEFGIVNLSFASYYVFPLIWLTWITEELLFAKKLLSFQLKAQSIWDSEWDPSYIKSEFTSFPRAVWKDSCKNHSMFHYYSQNQKEKHNTLDLATGPDPTVPIKNQKEKHNTLDPATGPDPSVPGWNRQVDNSKNMEP